jgi:hypothetical protein
VTTGIDEAGLARIRTALQQQRLVIMGVQVTGRAIKVQFDNRRYRRDSDAISRVARVLSNLAPAEIDFFEITTMRMGQPMTTVTLPREHLDKIAKRESSPTELWFASSVAPATADSVTHLQPGLFPNWRTDVFPLFRQSLFDPKNPLYVEFGVGVGANVELARGFSIDGYLAGSIYDNFGGLNRGSDSVLPHVRSDFAEYLKHGRYGIGALTSSYYFKFAPEIYGRVTAGYLEQMYAGVGAEVLYRPFGGRWAVGANLWTVRQRGFEELFALRHYQAITGHLSAYYDMPWHDIHLSMHVGQYLAGDQGVTFEALRRFVTGVQIGAWFTLTNVSAAQFGEGSFDKGIRIVIPLEWAAPFSSQGGYDLQLRPITRDGGQRLYVDTRLYDMTDPSDYGALSRQWNSVFGP